MGKIPFKPIAKTGAILLALAVYTLGAYFFSLHTPYYKLSGIGGGDRISYDKAQVISIDKQQLKPDTKYTGMLVGFQDVTIRMLSGEYKGRTMKLENDLNYDINYQLKPNETIIVSVNTTKDGKTINLFLYSPDRSFGLFAIIGLFAVSLCLIGRKSGFHSVIGIAFTLVNVIFIFIPLLYRGFSPALAALLFSAVTAFITLLLTSGWHPKTASAILGTIVGVAFSACVLRFFEWLTSLSGYNMSDYDALLALSGHTGMNVQELLFAAIVISSLGAVMDIAISVASSVNEVHLNNPQASSRTLFHSGIRVGRDMMGTMSNTLILAFTGSSLSMLVLIYTYNFNFNEIWNANSIAIDIVQALSASLAVIFTVPLVSLIASQLLPFFARNERHPVEKLPPSSKQPVTRLYK